MKNGTYPSYTELTGKELFEHDIQCEKSDVLLPIHTLSQEFLAALRQITAASSTLRIDGTYSLREWHPLIHSLSSPQSAMVE